MLTAAAELRLFVSTASDAEVEVEAGGASPPPPEVANGGQLHRVAVGEEARWVEVRAQRAGSAASWRLPLIAHNEPDWLTDARRSLRAGDAEAARTMLAGNQPMAAAERSAVRGLEARLALFAGDAAAARRLLAESVASHRAAGSLLDEIDDATVLAWLLIDAQDFAGARGVLDALPHAPTGFAEADYYLAFYRGLLAEKVGDLGGALAASAEAATTAARVAMAREGLLAEQIQARQLQLVGRAAEAAELFAGLRREPDALEICERGQLLNNSAWALLLSREAEERTTDDPVPLLTEALEIFTGPCEAFASEADNVRLNLTLAQVQAGRPDAARAALAEVARAGEPRLRLWVIEIEARLALAAGDAATALRRYAELAALAASVRSPEAAWRAAVGEGVAEAALGEMGHALETFASAEALLDAESLRVPFLEGRDTFLAQRQRGARLYVDLLLTAGRQADALAAARRARSRIVRGLGNEARVASLSREEQGIWDAAVAEYRGLRAELEGATADLWQLPSDRRPAAERALAEQEERLRTALERALSVVGDETHDEPLAPASDGELLLAYHPLPQGWVAFARLGERVEARRLACVDPTALPQALAACLIEPFARAIGDAERIRILAYGPLLQVDFHALPWRGQPLIAARPVAYGLDAGHEPRPHVERPGGTALLVADPRGDLPAARAEARQVGRLLASTGLAVQVLEGPAAVGGSLRAALLGTALFHYAGHAIFGGRGGWESALPLADGSALTVGDVLALPSVPAVVVLAGCETGRAAADAPAPGLGLAQAFATAGASAVVAASRPVADRDAGRVSTAFYRHWARGRPPADALRAAQLEVRAADASADWASFRLLEP